MPPSSTNYTIGSQTASNFGVHEITLHSKQAHGNPFLPLCQVTFVPPSGKANAVTVDAFYDGNETWRARVYLTETGNWQWKSQSNEDPNLNGQHGSFTCRESNLRGMLRVHPHSATHWATEDGQWFLNLNDTGYHLFLPSEQQWQEYVRDLDKQGITSVRACALGRPWWDTPGQEPSTPWQGDDYTRFNLTQFQTVDQRLGWMLNHYPQMYVQLILFSVIETDRTATGKRWAEIPAPDRENTIRYMLARWAAFPQIFWLVINDIFVSEDYPENQAFVREVGNYVAEHDPWQHLLSVGPRRKMIFPFHPSSDPWVSYVHLEDQYDMNADSFPQYASWNQHIFLGEDRYEHDRKTRDPLHPDYFFRWLFWSWLLSGGSTSYGGRWRTLTPYSQTGEVPYSTNWGGQDEITYSQRLSGLDSIPHIKSFFTSHGIELWQFTSDDPLVEDTSGQTECFRVKLARRGWDEILIYHPNVTGTDREIQPHPEHTASLRLDLSASPDSYTVEWFRPSDGPSDGATEPGADIKGGKAVELTAPWKGTDAVLRLTAQ